MKLPPPKILPSVDLPGTLAAKISEESSESVFDSVMQMIFLPLVGLGQGAQPIISYNYGAGNNKRVKQTFWLLFGVSLGFAAAIWAAIRSRVFCPLRKRSTQNAERAWDKMVASAAPDTPM